MTGEELSSSVEVAKNQFDEGRYSECLNTLNGINSTATSPLSIKVCIILEVLRAR